MITAIEAVLRSEIVGYGPERDSLTFEALGLDSFDLVSLRSAVEAKIGRDIPDAEWILCRSPAQLKRYFATETVVTETSRSASLTRQYNIGMPQMAVGGLSENWLFKEIGDLHWSMITSGLGVQSSQISDGSGNRLYATFTRFRVETNEPWSAYGENEALLISGSLARYGSGQFLGTFDGAAGGKGFTATVLSSFSARSTAGLNSDLRKGQPVIPPDCSIPALTEKPAFIEEYQKSRGQRGGARVPIFSRHYEINPYVDINGVGLLYFAAYSTISDYCEMSHFGRDWPRNAATISRDVFYFANSDASETLLFNLISAEPDTKTMKLTSTISRADGTPMAMIETRKSLRRPAGALASSAARAQLSRDRRSS